VGVTARPGGPWTVQQAGNLLMGLGERAARFRYLARDRAGQFTGAFGVVLAGAGIEVAKIAPRSPGANAHGGRWVRAARAGVNRPDADHRATAAARDPGRARLQPASAAPGTEPAATRQRDITMAAITGLAAARTRARSVLGGLINEYQQAA
jgi:hypothetical protein